MSKPIFIARLPHYATNEDLENVRVALDKKLTDYHSLLTRDLDVNNSIKFECYNAPHTEIEFKELKEMILNLLSKQKQTK